MSERDPLPEGVPKGLVEIKAQSEFGSRQGYSHYIDPEAKEEDTYYLGLTLAKQHGGAPGRGHGAVTMAMLDEVMGRAASRKANSLCYTASMTTNFCAATRMGEFLLARARVTRAGKSLVFVDATLHSGETLIATATGCWANSGKPIPFSKESS